MARSSFGDVQTKDCEERPPRRKSRDEQRKENLRLYQSVWLQQSAIPFVKKATSYDIVRQVGRGTFSSVFFVRHRSYPDGVAMKVIDKERVTEASDVRKVLRNVRRVNSEVTLLLECDHDGICTVFDAFQTQKHVFIFMDFVERDLFHLLSSFPDGLPEKLARSMNRIVAQTLQYLHHQGIAHRDIKPENVLVKGSLSAAGDERPITVKLCDFGLSLKPEAFCNDFVGSPGFFAPEILLESSYDAFKCDVWSFGAVVLETLLGTPDFRKIWLQAYATLDSRPVFSEAVKLSISRLDSVEFLRQRDDDVGRLVRSALCFDASRRAGIDDIVSNKWFDVRDDEQTKTATISQQQSAVDRFYNMSSLEDAIPEIPKDDQNANFRRYQLQSKDCMPLPRGDEDGQRSFLASSGRSPTRRRNRSFSMTSLASLSAADALDNLTLPAMTICHLDDSSVARLVVEANLSMVFPYHRLINYARSAHLVQYVMASQQLVDDPANEIRVCIFDQHIQESITGSDIAKMLRVLGYEGLIFCMTADYESELFQEQSQNVFDGILSKQIPGPQLHKVIVDGWHKKYGRASLVHRALLSPTPSEGRDDFRALRVKCLKQILAAPKDHLTHGELLEIKGDLEAVKCSRLLLDTIKEIIFSHQRMEGEDQTAFSMQSPLYLALQDEFEATFPLQSEGDQNSPPRTGFSSFSSDFAAPS